MRGLAGVGENRRASRVGEALGGGHDRRRDDILVWKDGVILPCSPFRRLAYDGQTNCTIPMDVCFCSLDLRYRLWNWGHDSVAIYTS